MAAPFVGGASPEAPHEEVQQVLHNRVNNVGGKDLMGRLSCSVPRPPDFTVGLDVPLKELKTQLLKEKEQQLLLIAPGGCGKTALVKMLGHDQEIKGIFCCCVCLS